MGRQNWGEVSRRSCGARLGAQRKRRKKKRRDDQKWDRGRTTSAECFPGYFAPRQNCPKQCSPKHAETSELKFARRAGESDYETSTSVEVAYLCVTGKRHRESFLPGMKESIPCVWHESVTDVTRPVHNEDFCLFGPELKPLSSTVPASAIFQCHNERDIYFGFVFLPDGSYC
jgi:hypothetical protein